MKDADQAAGPDARSSGHGGGRHRGRSVFRERELREAMRRLLALGDVEAEPSLLETALGRVGYLDLGAGPALVALHGGGGGGANWYRLLGPLARDRRVLAPDLPGFGLSSPIPLDGPLGDLGARSLLAWAEALGLESFDLLATSFGGLVALRLALSEPARIRRLVLLDVVGLGRELPWSVRLATVPVIGPVLAHPSRAGTLWTLRRLMTDTRLPPADETALHEYLWRSATMFPEWMPRVLRLFADAGGQREILTDAELAAVRAPTLVVWGERDGFLPVRHGRRAAERIAGARLHVIPGAGHSPNWEAPDALLAVLQPFLRDGAIPA